tara:strand:- start:9049 stop:9261 length:213 start_codon:yes stop_codon:yes gene_type:complete
MGRTVTELKEAISNLEQVLDSGATTVAQDGSTTVFDLDRASARLKDLKAELSTLQGKKTRRPIFNRIDLS